MTFSETGHALLSLLPALIMTSDKAKVKFNTTSHSGRKLAKRGVAKNCLQDEKRPASGQRQF